MIKLNRTRFAFRLDSSQQFNTVSTLWRVEHTRVADSEMFWIKENFSFFRKPFRSKNHSFYSNSEKSLFPFKKYLKIQNKTGLLDPPYFHYFMKFPMNDHTICLPLKLQIEKPQSSYYYYVLWTHTSKQSIFFSQENKAHNQCALNSCEDLLLPFIFWWLIHFTLSTNILLSLCSWTVNC